MESYKLLESHYKLKIIKTTSQENKTIEMDTKSQFFQDLFFTKIGKIRLIFSANGIEIIPETSAKKTIFIEYFNISGIHLKESKIKDKQNTLTLLLTLYTPINNSATNKDIKELILMENIPIDYLEEAKKFTEEIKQTLGLSI